MMWAKIQTVSVSALIALCAWAVSAPPGGVPFEVKGRLVQKSPIPTLKSIAPYKEALVVFTYEVLGSSDAKTKGKRLPVAHWAIQDRVTQPITTLGVGTEVSLRLQPLADFPKLAEVKTSDDSGIFDPVWLDVGQKLKLPEWAGTSRDYGHADLTHFMPVFMALRGQLKLVALGDSRGMDAFQCDKFYGAENRRIPMAFNMSVGTAYLDYHQFQLDNYIINLPKLEWVVLCISPRVFRGGVSYRTLPAVDGHTVKSPAHQAYLAKRDELWKNAPMAPVAAEQVMATFGIGEHGDRGNAYTTPWGVKRAEVPILPEDLATFRPRWGDSAQVQRYLDAEVKKAGTTVHRMELGPGPDVGSFAALRRMGLMLGERGARLMLFTAPMAPEYGQTDPVTIDLVTRKCYDDIVRRLRKVESEMPNVHFLDINKGGRHDIPSHCFANDDHVNKLGSDIVMERLETFRQECEKKPFRKLERREVDPDVNVGITNTPEGMEWHPFEVGAPLWADERTPIETVPEGYEGLQYLSTAREWRWDEKKKNRPITFTVDQPVRVWVLWKVGSGGRGGMDHEWLRGYLPERALWHAMTYVGKPQYRMMLAKDFPAGNVTLGPAAAGGDVYTVLVGALR